MTPRHTPETLPHTDLARFKALLLERAKSLRGDVRGLEREDVGTAADMSGHSIHSADYGTDRAAQDVSLGCMEAATGELQEITDALERIRQGSFGFCETCGKKMSKERLNAIPYAKLCLSCRKEEEGL